MKKKAIAIVCASLVAVFAVTTLVLGLVKTNVNTVVSRPDKVFVMNARTKNNVNGYGAVIFEDLVGQKSDEITNVFNKFNSAFKRSKLDEILGINGDMSLLPKYVNTAAGSARVSRNYTLSTKITLAFYYKTPKTITVKEGTLNYNYIFFEISNENQKSTIKFGVDKAYDAMSGEDSGLDLELKGDETDGYITYDYGYVCNVNLYELYLYVAGLI